MEIISHERQRLPYTDLEENENNAAKDCANICYF